jgi:16S rRNA C1402 N4-methylase RsmH
MKKEIALEMLRSINRLDKPSKINPVMSHRQFVDIIEKAILAQADNQNIHPVLERRVHQAVRNQRRPRY